jgi:hypothetical protein
MTDTNDTTSDPDVDPNDYVSIQEQLQMDREDDWSEDEDGGLMLPSYFEDSQYDDDYFDEDDERDYEDYDYEDYELDGLPEPTRFQVLRDRLDRLYWRVKVRLGLTRCSACGKLRRFANHDDCIPF